MNEMKEDEMSAIVTETYVRQLIQDVKRLLVCDVCEPHRKLNADRCVVCGVQPPAVEVLRRAVRSLVKGDLGKAHWLARLAMQDHAALVERLADRGRRRSIDAASSLCDDPELLLGARAWAEARRGLLAQAVLDMRRFVAAGLASCEDVAGLGGLEAKLQAQRMAGARQVSAV